MLGNLTSLTGGGGLSNSSAASSATGDLTNNGVFNGGSVNLGKRPQDNKVVIAGIAAVTLLGVAWIFRGHGKSKRK